MLNVKIAGNVHLGLRCGDGEKKKREKNERTEEKGILIDDASEIKFTKVRTYRLISTIMVSMLRRLPSS